MKLEKGRGSRVKTLGELSLEMQSQTPEKIGVNELGNEILQKNEVFMRKLLKCIENGLEVFKIPVVYVEVHMWMSRTVVQQPNIRMKARASCATPTYGQTVFKYDSRDGHLQTLWSMPDRESSIAYLHNKKIIPVAEQKNLFTVLDFYNGKLDALRKQEQDVQDEIIRSVYDDGIVVMH
jgi:hypothetical protein